MDAEKNDCKMELRILKDGTVVLVAPDSELLEAIETIITDNDQHNLENHLNDHAATS